MNLIQNHNKDILNLCEYIYSGEQFGYKRKYDKYLLIKNHKFEKC